MGKFNLAVPAVMGLALTACASEDVGNARLGITRFEVHESAESTTVIGWSDAGKEVGRVELTHGRLTLSEAFAENGGAGIVVGRRLIVEALDQYMKWETEGFEPTLQMPAHPAHQWAIATLLEDPQVKPILQHWSIGFKQLPEPPPIDWAPNPYSCDINGTHPRECSGQPRCPTVANELAGVAPPSTCGGGLPAITAFSIHQRAHAGYRLAQAGQVTFDQSVVIQCCPGASPGQGFFAFKTCPVDCGGTRCPNTCGLSAPIPGTNVGSCQACQQYLVTTSKCTLFTADAHRFDPHTPLGRARVVDVCHRVAWECGDGFCDADETAESCSADCD
jgi:hypothetical protein